MICVVAARTISGGMLRQEGMKFKANAFDDESIFLRLRENTKAYKSI